ncbi:hypothetical protein EXD82_04890 [Peptacetobacter hominis]|uniref:Uncharacterized protein n=1 Tax=Peptacetobacter hominis TaxID=2743610 RepID=A0A544QVM6_9FIRM|nr:hypothetical protein [Peptacetobacter hominis]TQQ84741.1 hypothetical protein EXD82_04890 [Peptacetobacter hominis]
MLLTIELTKELFDYKFKQYEGTFFHANIDEYSDIIKYTITRDKEGKILMEFGSTHMKDNLIFIPQLDVYMDLEKLK